MSAFRITENTKKWIEIGIFSFLQTATKVKFVNAFDKNQLSYRHIIYGMRIHKNNVQITTMLIYCTVTKCGLNVTETKRGSNT